MQGLSKFCRFRPVFAMGFGVGDREENVKGVIMRLFATISLVLVSLLVVGWIVAWFVGRSLLMAELNARLLRQEIGDLVYEADSYEIRGFPFSYRILAQGARLSEGGTPGVIFSDDLSAQIALASGAWGFIQGSEISLLLAVAGEHELAGGLRVTADTAWIRPKFSQVSLFDGTDDWRFDGLDFRVENLHVARVAPVAMGQTGAVSVDRLALVIQAETAEFGQGGRYAYDLEVTGLVVGQEPLEGVSNRLDILQAKGRLQPDLRAAYLDLYADLQADPLAAFVGHSQVISDLLSSEPGIYLDEGRLEWGDARLDAALALPFQIQPFAMQATVGLKAEISAQRFGSQLQALLREPAVQSSDVAALVNAVLIGTRRMGLDLEAGQPSTLAGPLLTVGRSGIELFPEGLRVNGRLVAGF